MNIYRKSDIPAHLQQYFVPAEIGLEPTPDAYVAELVAVFREVRRVLTEDGTLWLNLGDSYSASKSGAVGASPRSTLTGGGGKYRAGSKVEKAFNEQQPVARESNGDSVKHKDLVGIPWMVAFALRADGWYLRRDIIWAKPNPMPESVRDRPTSSHEYLFLLTKNERYYYDAEAIAEPIADASVSQLVAADTRIGSAPSNGEYKESQGRGASRGQHADRLVLGGKKQDGHGRRHAGFNPAVIESGAGERPTRNARSVWTIATQPYKGAHFATFPEELPRRCLAAGSAPGDTVLDPFGGSGTTAAVAVGMGRNPIHIDLNPNYIELAKMRIGPMLCTEAL